MSTLRGFFKQNQKKKDIEVKVAITDRFVDEEGNPLEWILKPCSGKKSRKLTERYTVIDNKGNTKFLQADYMHALALESIAFPDLSDSELQDDYGVMEASDLLDELLPTASEYTALMAEVNRVNTDGKDLNELVEEAKN